MTPDITEPEDRAGALELGMEIEVGCNCRSRRRRLHEGDAGQVSGLAITVVFTEEERPRGVVAAIGKAAGRAAFERVATERLLTARRKRAVERRRVPALTAAEAALSPALEEAEREDAARSRWLLWRRQKRETGVRASPKEKERWYTYIRSAPRTS